MAARVLQNPSRITVETSHDDSTIEQLFFPVRNHENRLEVLQKLLSKYRPESTIVFCNTKADTDEVAQRLQEMNFSAVALHGDMEQRERNQTLVCFANKSASILVATDVAARGIDIAELDAVVNFQIAKTPDVHTHRIGRTGRAGKQGIAFTLFSEKEAHRVAQLPLDNDPFANPIQEPDDAFLDEPAYQASMVTLQIDAGKKQKIRPGDILGALTGGDAPLQGQDVGKISIFDQYAYFAVSHTVAKKALKKVTREPLKGRKVRVRQIRN
jgi:ATP-independent RNA helicase DbpA